MNITFWETMATSWCAVYGQKEKQAAAQTAEKISEEISNGVMCVESLEDVIQNYSEESYADWL